MTTQDTTPAAFARYANEFLDAALITDVGMGGGDEYDFFAPVPVMYLIGHSIELSLMSYLLYRGKNLDEVRYDFGHNLIQTMDAAINEGLDEHIDIDSHEKDALKILNELYASKQLNHIHTGLKEIPSFAPLESLAKKLLETVSGIVGWRTKYHY